MRKILMNYNLLVFILGLGAFSWGLYLAWPPLGPIGGGIVLMAISIFGGEK